MIEAGGFRIADEALQQAIALGFGQFAVNRLARMALQAAPVTHARGNRRYHDYVLTVRGEEVLSVARMQPAPFQRIHDAEGFSDQLQDRKARMRKHR